MTRPLILISNDDGINAPTLDLLAESVIELGDLLIVAPATNQSSMGRSYPKVEGGGVIKSVVKNIKHQKVDAYAVSGSPSLVIDHAIEEIVPRLPDICLTGINPGENIGSTMAGSGTVMAAIEASSYGLPAIAFSKVDEPTPNFEAIRYWCHRITKQVLSQGLPQRVSALNVNFPEGINQDTSLQFTRLSQELYFHNAPILSRDTAQPHHFQVIKQFDPNNLEEDSDINCLIQKKQISITPISWDFTARINLANLSDQYDI